MSNSILDSVSNLFNRNETAALADQIGVPLSSAQSGIKAAVAALLEEVAKRSGDSEFMVRLFNMAQNFAGATPSGAAPARLDTTASPATAQGSQIASTLLGNHLPAVESAIANRSGFSLPASHLLLAAVAAPTLSVLGQRIQNHGFNLFSFSQLIRSEATKIGEHFGAPISARSPLTVPGAAALAATGERRPGGLKNIFILLGLLALMLLIWLAVRGCKDNTTDLSSPTAASAPVSAPAAAPGPLGEFIDRKLPDGTVLHIPRLGIENRLIDFIEDSSKPVDKTTWFDFDRLTFDTGAATLQPASGEQLRNIAAILKAYPSVHAKIGGYTDNTGNQATNLKLSQDRAQNVMEELVTDGTAASRLEAKGYGEEHPVADNATSDGRQKNRRISLLVTAK